MEKERKENERLERERKERERKEREILENEKRERERLERERKAEEERKRREEEEKKRLENQMEKRFGVMKSYTFIPRNIVDLIKAVSKGPVVVAQYVSSQFKFYSNGVFDGEGCSSKRANHTSTLVGYNLDAEIPYFIAKNSWGPLWGDKGYYKIAISDIGMDK